MAKCKYPNEVCANMTMLRGVAYCDSTPCSLKGELPKRTNADSIRAMSDEELADRIMCPNEMGLAEIDCDKSDDCNCHECCLKWLQSESEE